MAVIDGWQWVAVNETGGEEREAREARVGNAPC